MENDESIIVKATILEESCAVSTVILNATIIGGSASLAMNDSGINGDETAGDNIYSATTTASGITKTQTANLTITAQDSLSNTTINTNVSVSTYKQTTTTSSSSLGGGGGGGGGAAGSSIEGVKYFEIIKISDRIQILTMQNNELNFTFTNIAGVSMKGLTINVISKTCSDCFSFEITKELPQKYLPYVPVGMPINISIKDGTPAGEYQMEIDMRVDTGSKIKKADSRIITIIVPEHKSKRTKPIVEREIYLDKEYLEDRFGFGELYTYPKFEIKLNVKNGPNKVENLKVIESIPKEILENINDTYTELRIDGKSDKPYFNSKYPFTIIDPDPIIEFDLGSAEPFEEKTVSYTINKERIDTELFSNSPEITYESIEIIEDKPTIICGDNTCTPPDENITNCPQDCEITNIKQTQLEKQQKIETTNQCGNQICDENESKENCPQDCQTTQTNFIFESGFLTTLGSGLLAIIVACAIIFVGIKLRKSYLVSHIANKEKTVNSLLEEINFMTRRGYKKREIIARLLMEGHNETEIINSFQNTQPKKGIIEKIKKFTKRKTKKKQ